MAKNNINIIKQKEKLEKKLIKEISRNFSISEKLAKKCIYEAHLSLENLKNDIKNEKLKNTENFEEKKLEKLYSAILGAKKLIEDFSKKDLEELRKILENNNFEIGKTSEILEKVFSKNLIEKSKNPKKVSEHLMGASLGFLNSTIITGELIYSVGIGILKTPKDLYNILAGKAEIESFKKV